MIALNSNLTFKPHERLLHNLKGVLTLKISNYYVLAKMLKVIEFSTMFILQQKKNQRNLLAKKRNVGVASLSTVAARSSTDSGLQSAVVTGEWSLLSCAAFLFALECCRLQRFSFSHTHIEKRRKYCEKNEYGSFLKMQFFVGWVLFTQWIRDESRKFGVLL